MSHLELAAAISAAPSTVAGITEQVHVQFDPAALLPDGKRLLSLTVETNRFGGRARTVVYGTALIPQSFSGSHRVELPGELADRYLPQAENAAIVAELRYLAGEPLTALCDQYGGTTVDVVQEVLLNRAHDLEDGAAQPAAHAA